MVKAGLSLQEVRATPHHIIEKLLLYWHLQNVANEAQERKAKAGSK